MSDNPHGEWSTGKFVRVCISLPPIEVDCSTWESDIPADQWSKGKFVSLTRSLPLIEGDCVVADADQPVWLELVVSFRDDTPPAKVMEHTNRMIRLVHAAAPDLGLTYDFTRSRTEGEAVIVALAPTVTNGARQRLEQLVGMVGNELAKLQGADRVVLRLAA